MSGELCASFSHAHAGRSDQCHNEEGDEPPRAARLAAQAARSLIGTGSGALELLTTPRHAPQRSGRRTEIPATTPLFTGLHRAGPRAYLNACGTAFTAASMMRSAFFTIMCTPS